MSDIFIAKVIAVGWTMSDVAIGTTVPLEYANALDEWIISNLGPTATRADGLRQIIPNALGLSPIMKVYVKKRTLNERDDHAEILLDLKRELGSWKAVANHENLSVSRVRQIVTQYECRAHRSALNSQSNLRTNRRPRLHDCGNSGNKCNNHLIRTSSRLRVKPIPAQT